MPTLRGGGLILATSLFAVGFASWKVDPQEYVSISATADEVDEIKIFSVKEASAFTLCKDGIVSDETIVSGASIVIKFDINNKNADSLGYLKDNTFLMSISLTPNKADFLSYVTSLAVEPNSVTVSDPTTVDSSLTYTLSFPISGNTGTTSASLTYAIVDSDGNISSLYEKSNQLKFDFKLRAVNQ